jgi:hypothetical protein
VDDVSFESVALSENVAASAFGEALRRRRRKKARNPRAASATTPTPTPIPALAPVDRPEAGAGVGVGVGVLLGVTFAPVETSSVVKAFHYDKQSAVEDATPREQHWTRLPMIIMYERVS